MISPPITYINMHKPANPQVGAMYYDQTTCITKMYLDRGWVDVTTIDESVPIRIAWCDDLDAPQIGVIMDNKWWDENKEGITEWLLENVGEQSMLDSKMIYIPDVAVRTMFVLQWL